MLRAVVQVANGEKAPGRSEVLACTHHRGEEAAGQHREHGVLHLGCPARFDQRDPVLVVHLEQPLLERLPGLGEGRRVHGLGLSLPLARCGLRRGIHPGGGRAQPAEGLLDRRLDLGHHGGVEVEHRADTGPGLLTAPIGQRGVGQVVVAGGLEARGRGALERTTHVLRPHLWQRLHRESRSDQEPGQHRDHAEQAQGGESAPEGLGPPALRVVIQGRAR